MNNPNLPEQTDVANSGWLRRLVRRIWIYAKIALWNFSAFAADHNDAQTKMPYKSVRERHLREIKELVKLYDELESA